jgi:5-methylcytosine-specific restriction endonuclease McrA
MTTDPENPMTTPEQKRQANAAWKKANPEKVRAQAAAYYRANVERVRASSAERERKNRERRRAQKAAYYLANRERMLTRSREWGRQNRDRTAAISRAWRAANPEAARAVDVRRAARKHGADCEPYDRLEIFIRDGWTCQLCLSPISTAPFPDPLSATIDHTIPLIDGGADAPDNVCAAHLVCNQRKNAMTLDEYLARWPRIEIAS